MGSFESKVTISAVDKVTGVVAGITRSLDKLKASTGNLSSAWNSVSNAGGEVVSKIRNLALATVAAGAGIFTFASRFSDMAESLSLTSQRIGISIERLQKLQYVANLSGISIDEMNSSLKFLNRSIANAASDATSDAATAFNSMGIKVKDVNGNLKNAYDITLELADVFNRNADGASKVATSMAVMGRGGTALIPVLNEGSGAIKAQMDNLAKYGRVLSDFEVEQGKEFDDRFKELKASIQGVSNAIAIELIPQLQPIVESLRDWIAANKVLIADKIKQFIIDVGAGFKIVWQNIKAIGNYIWPVINAFGGLKTIIAIFAGTWLIGLGFRFAQLIVGFAQLTQAVAGFSLAILASPITWLIGGIALLGVGLYQLYTHWNQVKDAIASVWQSVKQPFEAFANLITLGMYGVVKSIFTNWDSIAPYFNSVWGGIKSGAISFLDSFFGLFGTSFDAVSEKITSVINDIESGLMSFVDFVAKPFQKLGAFLGGIAFKIVEIKNAILGSNNKNSIIPDIKTPSLLPGNISEVTAPPRLASENYFDSFKNIRSQQQEVKINNLTGTSNQSRAGATQDNNNVHLDINMKIDSEGRPQKVTAKSSQPISFSANTGLMI